MTDSAKSVSRRRRAGFVDRATESAIVEIGRRITKGTLTVEMPEGMRHTFRGSGDGPDGEIRLLEAQAVWRIVFGGEIGAGEAFMDGQWDSPDLVSALIVAAVNRDSLGVTSGWLRTPLQVPRTIAHRARRNSVSGSSRNIQAHYDLGNDFYKLFLDETMTYSSAVFATAEQSLADAQRNKYLIHAERAGIERGMRVLEIGSGWGGFAIHAAGELGCDVTSVTVSPAQHELANQRIALAGLSARARVELCDYRNIVGDYDAIVSIEMLEAVGAEYYERFFAACDIALRPGGRMSLQSICFPDAAYESQRSGVNWIQQYIFPGGLLPSLAAIERSLHGTRLLVAETHDIRADYVRTLATWRKSFFDHLPQVRGLGFDDRFIRTWHYYLALSEAGFATGLVQDQQIVLQKSRGV